jgi:hypothetical protein
MRLPWEQLAMEVIEVSAPELGDKLYPDMEPDLAEAAAGWGIVHLVKWALARCPDELPPSASDLVPGPTAARQIARAGRWRGNPEAYVAALAALPDPIVEVRPEGIRLRGLQRYDAAWGDRNKSAWDAYKATHPDKYPPPEPRRKSAGAPTGSRPPDPDPDADPERDVERKPPPPSSTGRPKLVVVAKHKKLTVNDLTPAQLERWEAIQQARERRDLLRETDPPADFPRWSDAADAEGIVLPRQGHALVLYLRDEHFRERLWPTAVFITDGVFRQRLPEPLEAAQ